MILVLLLRLWFVAKQLLLKCTLQNELFQSTHIYKGLLQKPSLYIVTESNVLLENYAITYYYFLVTIILFLVQMSI